MIRGKILLIGLTALVLIAIGCGKPADTSTKNAAKPSASPVAKTTAKKALPSAKVIPVPANWITMADEEKGYGFMVPEGTQRQNQTSEGIDVFMAKTPEPSSVSAFVMAFKDKSLSKDDLIQFATKFLEGLGEKDVKVTDVVELSDDYSLGMVSSVDDKGNVTKGKVLVATDVTDNYVMLLGTDEKEFTANEKIMDEIWGSFTMSSGGASGSS